MLNAPISDAKTESTHSKSQIAARSEQKLHPHAFGATSTHSFPGAASIASTRSSEAPQRLPLTGMQSAYGNQAVLRTLHSPQQVAHMPALRPSQSMMLQRQCACGGSSESAGECAECKAKREGALQRQASKQASPTAGNIAPPIVHDVLNSPGQPLDAGTRAFMEPRFGHDFSQVRVHTDARAAESARAVSALAYTVGRDVVFGTGQYAPGSSEGRRLMAHELTHVVQQRDVSTEPELTPSSPDDNFEREATASSFKVVSGEDANIKLSLTSSSKASIQRDVAVPQTTTSATSSISVPETDAVDSEFWFTPPNVRPTSVPIFDDQDTHVVIGFIYRSSGYYEVYDLQGNIVETGERPLEQPLIDPIDIVAGLFAGLFAGGVRSAARSAARGLERGAAEAAAETGVRSIIRTLTRRTVDAIRGIYRGIRFSGPLEFTETTAARMADAARRVPQHILKLALRFGSRSPDPQGAAGAFRYVIQMFRSGKPYTLEVVIREADQTVLHFLYK